jgi:hypothetical protein
MWSQIFQQVPEEFDRRFLAWMRGVEDLLLVKLADWSPSVAEAQVYAESIDQSMPKDLSVYYESAYPFGRLRDGWRKWNGRQVEYRRLWGRALTDRLGVEPAHAQAIAESAPPLWPIYCLEKERDIVGFVGENDAIAIIELDPSNSGKARPLAMGLRNYFLAEIAAESLAEDRVQVDLGTWRDHPAVRDISGWPAAPSAPGHVSLTLGSLERP